jgi:chromosome segregation ATPase
MANKQVQEYDKLTKEIEETVEKQNKMYYELKNIDEEDVQSANIDSTITDLQERRNNIMNFLEGKYNNNTELRKSLFDNLYENKKELTVQEHEMNELEKKIRDQNEEKTTFHKKVNNQKYKTNKYNYYNQYLAILVVIQIFR